MLVAELIALVDLEHVAAQPVCRLYEDALAGIAVGRFHAAQTLFQALRAV
jgi:hypothetical protein